MTYKILSPRITAILCICASELMAAGNEGRDFSPTPQEEQLPTAMHSKMAQLPRVTVSHKDADLVGSDNRVLQAAVDYVAGLGAGTVEIGEGEYVMRDSLHLRPNVTVRNYNGDGISFQQSNDVTVVDCVSEDNAVLGIHPGSGSQRPTVRNCAARRNGGDGLFLCWRVRHGLFEDNLLEENGQFGISIGHKDSDNVLRRNTVRLNKQNGVFFRNEALGMAPHRNRLEDNTIENNGGAEIRIRGEVNDLTFIKNTIRDTRQSGDGPDVGILIEEHVGKLNLHDNTIQTKVQMEDKRASKAK